MTKLVIIIKPGFLDKTNEVIEAYSNLGFSIDERKIDILTREQCNIIWGDIYQKELEGHFPTGYFNEYYEYIMSGNVECISLSSQNTIDYNEIITLKRELRVAHNVEGMHDLLHTSDSTEDAILEIECLF